MAQQPLIHYHIRWRPSGYQPGAGQGVVSGAGDQLRSVVPLRDHPDPRRLDIRTSVRDPFNNIWVRDFYLNSALKVIVLIDTSASMGYIGQVNRFHVARDIASQLALSAYRSGDAFGVYVAGEKMNKKRMLPPKANRSAWMWLQQHFTDIKLEGSHADGLFDVVPYLPQNPCLVFIVSDFRWPEGRFKSLLKKLSHHDVVPVMLQDPSEIDEQPKRGIAILQDAETGAKKFVWMRPGLQAQMEAMRTHHVKAVNKACNVLGTRPFIVRGEFKASAMTEYFMGATS